MQSDGTYKRTHPKENAETIGVQEWLMTRPWKKKIVTN
jgi:hypothetical protein